MGITVIAPATQIPSRAYAPVIDIKQRWTDDWGYDPHLELVRAVAVAGSHDLGSCELKRRYGILKQPFDSDHDVVPPVSLMGWWVRLRLLGEQGLETVWVGQISGEPRTIHGSDLVPSGVQTFMAYEAQQMLRKRSVSVSYWREAATTRRMEWVAGFNARDPRRGLVGNRTAEPFEGAYHFGGTGLWSRYDAAEYILRWFMTDQDHADPDDDGPAWRLGGQVELLSGATDSIALGQAHTVAEVMRKLIPRELGMDYVVIPLADGFEISIYALTAVNVSFGGASVPKNPNQVTIRAASSREMTQAHVAVTRDQAYDFVRLVGARVVVCCTLFGTAADAPEGSENSLVPQWTSALETAYKAGTGTPADAPFDHDQARKADIYRPVYRLLGAPQTWDHQDGAAAPNVSDDGEVETVEVGGIQVPVPADYQGQVKHTLPTLPLREGWDYSTDPPTLVAPAGQDDDFAPPAVWIYDEDAARYVLAEEVEGANIGVSVSGTTLGVYLSVSPNYLLALGHFDSAAETVDFPTYDYAKIIATVAFESDQRLTLEFPTAVDDSKAEVKDIEVPDAEIWYLAPNTVVGVNPDGTLAMSGAEPRVLRNDSARVAPIMAGAMARYWQSRGRAEITMKGLLPWSSLLGQILTAVEEATDTHPIYAPITAIEWSGAANHTTRLKTGYA
jgi:hypothetical protein